MPPGRVLDPTQPTASELSAVRGQCQLACAREWQNEPGVTATCTAGNAFGTPTVRATTSPPTLATVTDAYEKGGGIFPSTTLSCELESTCCTVLDVN